jgi:hypothetical protein
MMMWLGGIADWIAEHTTVISAIITAVATGVMALFTIKLTAATAGLRDAADQQQRDTRDALKLTRDSLALTRDEFNATHRSKIIVHNFEATREQTSNGSTLCAKFFVVNKGTSDATILEIGGRIFLSDKFNPGTLPGLGYGGQPLAAGGFLRDVVIFGDPLATAGVDLEVGYGERGRAKLWCVGRVIYEDSEGRRRETGFCRSFDVVGERWVREPESDYEYAY